MAAATAGVLPYFPVLWLHPSRRREGAAPQSLTEKTSHEIGFFKEFAMAGTGPAMTKKRFTFRWLGGARKH